MYHILCFLQRCTAAFNAPKNVHQMPNCGDEKGGGFGMFKL